MMASDLFSIPFEEDRSGEASGAQAPRPERRVRTVSELTAAIRGALETGFGDLWVEGELSNCRTWNTGHMYFTLKDESAQIKVVMFRMAVRYLRFQPEDGLHVIARGRLSVYDPKGEYQLVCEHMEPHGVGARQLAFDQLKKRLHAEGLFDTRRKRPLPALPRRIGIVTSLDGAAIRDIIKVLRRRAPNASVLVRPTRVQGEGAAEEVARGVKALAGIDGVDVIIVGRGGGSVEDLWTFNEEIVARAIAAAPVPVVSAVGHEVDVTIADFVADVRAPTPSAAAEMVVAAKEEFCARIDRLTSRLEAAARGTLQRRRHLVHVLSSRRGLAAVPARLALRGRHAAELTHDLNDAVRSAIGGRGRHYRALRQRLEAQDLGRHLASIRARLTVAQGRIVGAADRGRHRADVRFRALAGRLENLSPLAVLARGYAVCWNADKTAVIRSADTVQPGNVVRVTLSDGELSCRVENSPPEEPPAVREDA
jgi:exodeoxyribonuclease VII large subunit